MTMPITFRFVGAPVLTASPQKRIQLLLENRLDGGADILAQAIFDRIIARFIGQ